MGNILLVPIRADALSLAADQPALETMADFTRLPYNDGERDVNADTANISEGIVSQPFQDENLYLKAGTHLHWSLPDTLTRGAHDVSGTDFPSVPNRWLVSRSRSVDGGTPVVEKQWVVESDYLYPDGEGGQSGSVSFPYAPDSAKGESQPFRYVGRTMPLAAWAADDPQAEYLTQLTAVGYGEPSFAAFYPNCHSVFGFHDDDYGDGPPAGLRYDVFGWYADAGADFLKTFVADFRSDYREQNDGAEPGDADLVAALADECQWSVTLDEGAEFPGRMLCYARITFQPEGDGEGATTGAVSPAVALANTGTEALSAYLAQEVDPSQKAEIEDQLEALSLSSKLANRQLDVGPKFQEARHEKGFTALTGGTLWSVTQETKEPAPADATDPQAESTLPEELAHQLNYLNTAQGRFDSALAGLDSLRRQLFADWYKYMVCAYPPEDAKDDYPQVDEVRNYVELKGLAPLDAETRDTGELFLELDAADNITGANANGSAADSLAARVAAALNELLNALAAYNDSADVLAAVVFKLTGQSLSALKTAGVPDDVLTKLETLKDQKFVGRGQFTAALDATISAAESEQYGAQVVAAARQTNYTLKQTPGPRYYQPIDPVVLMTGAAVEPTLRHGQDSASGDGMLACQLFLTEAAPDELLPNDAAPLLERVGQIETETAGEGFGFNVWTGQPWNPFLLEWEVEVFPVESGSNLEPERGAYLPEFINSNFTLLENEVDLAVQSGRGFVTKAANLYSGSCVLSPHASVQLQDQIETYLQDQLLEDYYTAQNVPTEERTDDYFTKHTADILDWYKQANCTASPVGALCNIIAAYERLTDPNFYCLSQALGGFCEALLMRKQTLQLDIADPLGFEDYRRLTEDVSAAVGDSLTIAPAPLTDFNPIRSGALKLLRLRLVDTFGQSRDVDCEQLITTEKLKVANSPYPVTLPPRLTQPARLNFRWLSAVGDDQEMNDHPATTPVCGWVLPNNLDDSLMVYDNRGRALGSVDESARWQPAPGAEVPVAVEEIPNPHLKQMVSYLRGRGETFLRDFISALDNALENIEPENFAQHQDMALLMGRPIALVRASINLELQGRPAVHQGWNAFRQDMRRNTRDTNGFDRVSFPVRIGEYRQFNDGVVGYWKEAGGGYEDDIFYAPQSDPIKDGHIKTHADDPMMIYQTVDSPPQVLALLIDPRGSIHATSGIVPVKSICIPPDQYTDALAAIEITFLSAPVLTEAGKLRLPLPAEPGAEWSWLQKKGGAWSEITSPGVVKKQDFLAAFTNGETVWARLLECGWTVAVDETQATVQPKDKRTETDLGSDLAPQVADIEDLLSRAEIGAVDLRAGFAGGQQLVEGWLKLRAATD
jgi:hypothetical protein